MTLGLLDAVGREEVPAIMRFLLVLLRAGAVNVILTDTRSACLAHCVSGPGLPSL